MDSEMRLDHIVHVSGTFDVADQGSGTYTILRFPNKYQIIVGKVTLTKQNSAIASCTFTIPDKYAFSGYAFSKIVQVNRNASQILNLEADASLTGRNTLPYRNAVQVSCETINLATDITVALPVYFIIFGYAYIH